MFAAAGFAFLALSKLSYVCFETIKKSSSWGVYCIRGSDEQCGDVASLGTLYVDYEPSDEGFTTGC